jgi:DNA-binding NtrC family response regulator
VRIEVESPGAKVEAQLAAGERLTLGREPTGDRTLVVPSASVSANHAALWLDGAELCVHDLGSRNGTWLRVPSQSTARVDATAGVSLHLAAAPSTSGADEPPPDADWTSADDYAEAIVRALRDWLSRIGLSADIVITPSGDDERADGSRIPLGSGVDLSLVVRDTVDAEWHARLRAVWSWVARQNLVFEAEQSTRAEGLTLASPAIRHAHRHIVDAATRGVRNLMLLGPSGAGKEGMAQAFHRHSGRSGPLVALNCSMFSKELLRSELFGAEEGAFTGATRRIVGAVERAQGGTLFLDEVGELSAESQAMLLRFLDRGEYQRLGGYGQTRTADLRIVCASNRDLRAASQRGEFRADLWYRLSVVVVDVPPLRERPEDIVAYLKAQRLGASSAHDALSPAAREQLFAHAWDGNFRELRNFLERLPAGPVDAVACRRALAQGSLAIAPAVQAAPSSLSRESWPELALRASDMFAADHAGALPCRWDDVKEYLEKYLKPLLFAQLAGLDGMAPRDQVDVQQLARRVDADRGTVLKQLARFFECYGGAHA